MKIDLRSGLGIVALVAATLALAACGGSSSSSGAQVATLDSGSSQSAAANTSTSTTSSEKSTQDILLEFTQCMRENGVDVPDPTFDENGQPQLGGANQAIDPSDPKFQAALQKCQSILQGIQQQFTPENQQALQDAALKYAKCMRANGVDVPDPDFSGNGGPGQGGAFGGNIDQSDPDFEAANEKCQSAFDGLQGPFGGGN